MQGCGGETQERKRHFIVGLITAFSPLVDDEKLDEHCQYKNNPPSETNTKSMGQSPKHSIQVVHF